MGNETSITSADVDESDSKEFIKLARSTDFTTKQVIRLHNKFKKADADNSGALDWKEFQNLLSDKFPDATIDQLRDLFVVFDTNMSGVIEFNELVSALNIVSKGDTEEKLEFYFDIYDNDANGNLSFEEVRNMVNIMSGVGRYLDDEGAKGDIGTLVDLIMNEIGTGDVITREQWIKKGKKSTALQSLLGWE